MEYEGKMKRVNDLLVSQGTSLRKVAEAKRKELKSVRAMRDWFQLNHGYDVTRRRWFMIFKQWREEAQEVKE